MQAVVALDNLAFIQSVIDVDGPMFMQGIVAADDLQRVHAGVAAVRPTDGTGSGDIVSCKRLVTQNTE